MEPISSIQGFSMICRFCKCKYQHGIAPILPKNIYWGKVNFEELTLLHCLSVRLDFIGIGVTDYRVFSWANLRTILRSQTQMFSYDRGIFICLPQLPIGPNISDFFDLCLHWVSVVQPAVEKIQMWCDCFYQCSLKSTSGGVFEINIHSWKHLLSHTAPVYSIVRNKRRPYVY